jgi:quercetin dioxygenase-like cupin family protein
MKTTPLLQDPRVDACRVSAAGDIWLTMDGKTTATWKRGDVRLIGRGVAHETKGGKALGEMIIVAIK